MDEKSFGVMANLLEQKQASEKKSEGAEKKGINLDELQQETEKLLALLKERETGYASWHELMHERLTNLHALISQALGK